MFKIESNEDIGLYLKKLILKRYKSVRKFCIDYLDNSELDSDDPIIIRNTANRFSQIINGKKSLQVYDLPIITDLLNTSCEDILSCGKQKVQLNCRRTNYNIAFSKNEKDWADYFSREDCIAAYIDEFGKTVLDYAIEFENYPLIKYMIDKELIVLESDEGIYGYTPNFIARTNIAMRPYEQRTIETMIYENKLLRTQILSLALKNHDLKVLSCFRAKEFPIQFDVNLLNCEFNFAEYYDETFLEAICESNDKEFEYFLQEYSTTTYGKAKIIWIYPFIDKIVKICVEKKDDNRALQAINAIIDHNKKAFDLLRKTCLDAAKAIKENLHFSYQQAVGYLTGYYRISSRKDFVSLNLYHFKDIERLSFNIMSLDILVKNELLKTKINDLNAVYEKILTLPNSLIKNN